tara:strand:- start:1382 stop:1720 length:339 start_codon:yes stop_codon:yes gene_type:complete
MKYQQMLKTRECDLEKTFTQPKVVELCKKLQRLEGNKDTNKKKLQSYNWVISQECNGDYEGKDVEGSVVVCNYLEKQRRSIVGDSQEIKQKIHLTKLEAGFPPNTRHSYYGY